MSYEDTLKRLSAGTVATVLQVWQAAQAGELEWRLVPELLALVVATANAQGAAVAQLAFRAYLEAHDAAPVAMAVASTSMPQDVERLTGAMRTILASDLETEMQLTRLAANEPLDAAASAYQAELDASPRVSGWRRQLESDACQLCQWWARDGRVWRTDHQMPRHPGCTCHQLPVIDEQTSNHQTESQARRAATPRKTA